jgi:hypothetical protein
VFLDDLALTSFDITAYRNALRDKYLPAEMVGLDPASEAYESLLDEYAFDGQSMNTIQQWIKSQTGRINDNFDPPLEFQDTLLKFNEKAEFAVDGTGNPVSDGAFDQQGRANDPNLHLGKDVTVNKDQEVAISAEVVTGYQRPDGSREPGLSTTASVEEIVNYYSRPLRDYPFSLQEFGDQAQQMQEAIDSLKADIAVNEAMIEDTQAQINYRDTLTVKLQSDISRREQELAAINAYHDQLAQEITSRQVQIRTYYEQIMELYNSGNQRKAMKNTGVEIRSNPVLARQEQ